jgi:hypothetical protein
MRQHDDPRLDIRMLAAAGAQRALLFSHSRPRLSTFADIEFLDEGTPSPYLDADLCTVRHFSQVFCPASATLPNALASDVEHHVAGRLDWWLFHPNTSSRSLNKGLLVRAS